jgi:hypothetical protein
VNEAQGGDRDKEQDDNRLPGTPDEETDHGFMSFLAAMPRPRPAGRGRGRRYLLVTW